MNCPFCGTPVMTGFCGNCHRQFTAASPMGVPPTPPQSAAGPLPATRPGALSSQPTSVASLKLLDGWLS